MDARTHLLMTLRVAGLLRRVETSLNDSAMGTAALLDEGADDYAAVLQAVNQQLAGPYEALARLHHRMTEDW